MRMKNVDLTGWTDFDKYIYLDSDFENRVIMNPKYLEAKQGGVFYLKIFKDTFFEKFNISDTAKLSYPIMNVRNIDFDLCIIKEKAKNLDLSSKLKENDYVVKHICMPYKGTSVDIKPFLFTNGEIILDCVNAGNKSEITCKVLGNKEPEHIKIDIDIEKKNVFLYRKGWFRFSYADKKYSYVNPKYKEILMKQIEQTR
ncbi:hypothetical protein HDR60_02440 [bacterium]|nr:hypothetical protein [bacterium]